MNRDSNVDSILDSWFTEGPTDLPDRTIDSIVDRLDENQQRRLTWLPGRGRMNRRKLALGGAAAVLIALVGAGVVFNWNLSALVGGRPTPSASPKPILAPTSDEAVFVRRNSSDVLVVGVDAVGRERVITRLAEAWPWPGPQYPAPAGALSPSGRLVMAAGTNPGDLRWMIFDLLNPEASPLEIAGIAKQDTDQLDYSYFANISEARGDGRASWGPGDRLVIKWFERIPEGGNSFSRNYFVSYVDAGTGDSVTLDIADELVILPYWASDGSGVLVEARPRDAVLLDDGTFLSTPGIVPEASCTKLGQLSDARLTSAGYAASPCVSPDGRLLADTSFVEAVTPTARVIVEATGESFVVAGQFVGWLELTP